MVEKIWGWEKVDATQLGNGFKMKHTKGLDNFLHLSMLPILNVPVRQRGITSSGRHLQCWHNVAAAARTWGGEIVLGWTVGKMDSQGRYMRDKLGLKDKKIWKLNAHAVWLNDKEKLSCVTKVTFPDTNFIQFIPWKKVGVGDQANCIFIENGKMYEEKKQNYSIWGYKKGYNVYENRHVHKGLLRQLDFKVLESKLLYNMFEVPPFCDLKLDKTQRFAALKPFAPYLLGRSLATNETLNEIWKRKNI